MVFVHSTGFRALLRFVAIFWSINIILIAGYQKVFAQGAPIKIETELVSFEVSVFDQQGKPIQGLRENDFILKVNGKERKIDFFAPLENTRSQRPLSMVFAIDVSGSITPNEVQKLQVALERFIARFADYNSRFAVVTFGMRTKILQGFTNNPKKLRKSFTKIGREIDGLSTHAYDAVDDAIRLIEKRSPKMIGEQIPRRIVLVISDGYPVGDVVSPKLVIERANRAETSVYALILPSYSRLSGGNQPVITLLEASNLIEKTGGKLYYAIGEDFDPLFFELANEIIASYAIAFYPDEDSKAEKRHLDVKIETKENYLTRQNRSSVDLSRDH
ncbi:MAG: VWA domain-containing protein [Pyrinomonadaceae bacterium]